ncbi:hypothetical protein [Ferrimonas balearica]|uniref:hypothetical protein n=1 Tax=Ferrimonas balearica TaxID=44012 RepID=UPI002278DC75|nr:hypothetical protein [Ferrimonas balearica]
MNLVTLSTQQDIERLLSDVEAHNTKKSLINVTGEYYSDTNILYADTITFSQRSTLHFDSPDEVRLPPDFYLIYADKIVLNEGTSVAKIVVSRKDDNVFSTYLRGVDGSAHVGSARSGNYGGDRGGTGHNGDSGLEGHNGTAGQTLQLGTLVIAANEVVNKGATGRPTKITIEGYGVNGGHGGNGGPGQNGGQGGKGGAAVVSNRGLTCKHTRGSGGNGGAGGPGGNGGLGASGGDGVNVVLIGKEDLFIDPWYSMTSFELFGGEIGRGGDGGAGGLPGERGPRGDERAPCNTFPAEGQPGSPGDKGLSGLDGESVGAKGQVTYYPVVGV